MKILGISSSPRKESHSSVHHLVKEVRDLTGFQYDPVSLRGKTISCAG
jgi:hypothetical protein